MTSVLSDTGLMEFAVNVILHVACFLLAVHGWRSFRRVERCLQALATENQVKADSTARSEVRVSQLTNSR